MPKLPNAEAARVPQEKITEYLLRQGHADAAGKSSFFLACGFRQEEWETFAERLCEHAETHEIATGPVRDDYGNVYTAEGPLRTPAGEETERHIRSVWIVEHGTEHPRLITAYPIGSP